MKKLFLILTLAAILLFPGHQPAATASQHDFAISAADANTGVTVRAAINAALQALASNNSGATEPATTYAYMWWADTTTGILKQRNAANDGWINKIHLNGTAIEWNAATELTIASGVITPTQLFHRVDTQGDAASDDLDTITPGTGGQMLAIRAEHTDRTVVVKHNTGNIYTDGTDISLDTTLKYVLFVYDATLSKWVVVGGSGGIMTPPGSTGDIIYNNAGAYGAISSSANVRSLLGAADYAAMRTQLSLVPGTNVQAYSSLLAGLAGLTPVNNSLIGWNGSGVLGVYSNFSSDDSAAQFFNASSPTKKVGIDASGVTAGKTAWLKIVATDDWTLAFTFSGATNVTFPSSGTLATRDGTETLSGKTLTAPKETVVTGGTCSTTYTPDLTAGSMFTLTLNGACNIANPTLAAGESFTIKLTQSSTTAPTWGNAFKWAAGTAPTWSTSATKYDIVACVSFEGTALQCSGLIDVR
jgi:hypothetical protein